MNTFVSILASLLVLAIVLNGIRTKTKPIARPATTANIDRMPNPPLLRSQPKQKSKQSRKFKHSLTDPQSKHAKLVGKRLDLAVPGKWTIVHFWATWCGSCVEASPGLVKLHEKYAPRGVEFVGVNLDKDPQAMAKYIAKTGISWPQIVTKKGWQSPVRLQHKVPNIPAIYLVTPEGRVIEAGLKVFEDADAKIEHHLGK